MGKKTVQAMDPEKAKEALLAAIDGWDIYEEILSLEPHRDLRRQEGDGYAEKRMRGPKPRLQKNRKSE